MSLSLIGRRLKKTWLTCNGCCSSCRGGCGSCSAAIVKGNKVCKYLAVIYSENERILRSCRCGSGGGRCGGGGCCCSGGGGCCCSSLALNDALS